jgi:flagellar biosynthesis protein FlhB
MYHIPMKEDRLLARALYASVEVNDQIPPEFYQAMAEVMAWVYRLKQEGEER